MAVGASRRSRRNRRRSKRRTSVVERLVSLLLSRLRSTFVRRAESKRGRCIDVVSSDIDVL